MNQSQRKRNVAGSLAYITGCNVRILSINIKISWAFSYMTRTFNALGIRSLKVRPHFSWAPQLILITY